MGFIHLQIEWNPWLGGYRPPPPKKKSCVRHWQTLRKSGSYRQISDAWRVAWNKFTLRTCQPGLTFEPVCYLALFSSVRANMCLCKETLCWKYQAPQNVVARAAHSPGGSDRCRLALDGSSSKGYDRSIWNNGGLIFGHRSTESTSSIIFYPPPVPYELSWGWTKAMSVRVRPRTGLIDLQYIYWVT
jgi:hypothetical protein